MRRSRIPCWRRRETSRARRVRQSPPPPARRRPRPPAGQQPARCRRRARRSAIRGRDAGPVHGHRRLRRHLGKSSIPACTRYPAITSTTSVPPPTATHLFRAARRRRRLPQRLLLLRPRRMAHRRPELQLRETPAASTCRMREPRAPLRTTAQERPGRPPGPVHPRLLASPAVHLRTYWLSCVLLISEDAVGDRKFEFGSSWLGSGPRADCRPCDRESNCHESGQEPQIVHRAPISWGIIEAATGAPK